MTGSTNGWLEDVRRGARRRLSERNETGDRDWRGDALQARCRRKTVAGGFNVDGSERLQPVADRAIAGRGDRRQPGNSRVMSRVVVDDRLGALRVVARGVPGVIRP